MSQFFQGAQSSTPITFPITVPQGGTGQTTLTDNAILLGNGVNSIDDTLTLDVNEMLIGTFGGPPNAFLMTEGPGIDLTIMAPNVEWAVRGNGVSWQEQGTDTTAAIRNGYVNEKGGSGIVITLPLDVAYGEVIRIAGKSSTGWRLAQQAGQTVHLGSSSTTVGVSGYIESTNRYDCVEVLCIDGAGTGLEWVVLSSVGTLTVN